MGRRRSRGQAAPKPRPKLDVMFNCLFCQTARAVEVKMVRLEQVGFLKCRVCNASFQSRISYLSEAVDVYSDWVDETEEANMKTSSGASASLGEKAKTAVGKV
uniref:Transcription elongation factor 1 homolog n=1 Tax=Prorocentrum micans TaxID=2945 RepID=A0A7S2TAU1_PROMC|mmetsp:Transcript_1366/g.1073  ORF Transcript_1366/g.1073 Transcript_1366/m.1073 type:complete len:103 (+) Transcript_1366:214-522(+)